MLNRPLNAVLVRLAIVAAALAALLLIAPAATAQEMMDDAPPCTMDGNLVECDYDENGTDAVADFSAMDPEGQGIDWEVEGQDAGLFDIAGGVLTFKDSPNFEMPGDTERVAVDNDPDTDVDETVEANAAGDNEYVLTVRATETLATGQEPPAESSALDVEVTVEDVDEPGSISLDRLQPQAGAALTASFTDPDRGAANDQNPENMVWLWSVPKVSRPIDDNEDHWQAAGAGTTNEAAYTPVDTDDASDVGKVLRVKVTYDDEQGTGKELIMLSYNTVREAPAENQLPVFDDNAEFDASVPEDTAVGTVVGVPVTATDPNADDIRSYTLTDGGDNDSFEIDIRTGVIKTAAALDHEEGDANDDGDYEITVNVFDPSNGTDTVPVTITATDVNEAPTVAGDATGMILEINSTPPDGYTYEAFDSEAYTATDPDDGDTAELELSLGGDDEDVFSLSETGVVTFDSDPNREDPKDANQDSVYKINVVATDEDGLTGMLAVTITVNNVDEDGSVSLSSIQPAIGRALTASVSDPDNGITSEQWQWARSGTEGGDFTDIEGATSATYTPKAEVEDNPATEDVNEADDGDLGMFLQATVMYRDKASPAVDADPDDDVDDTTARNEEVSMTSENAVRERPELNSPLRLPPRSRRERSWRTRRSTRAAP